MRLLRSKSFSTGKQVPAMVKRLPAEEEKTFPAIHLARA